MPASEITIRKVLLFGTQLADMERELLKMNLSQAERDHILKRSRGVMDAAEIAHCLPSPEEDSLQEDGFTRQYCLKQITDLIPKYTDSADERFINAAEMWYKIACLLSEDSA